MNQNILQPATLTPDVDGVAVMVEMVQHIARNVVLGVTCFALKHSRGC